MIEICDMKIGGVDSLVSLFEAVLPGFASSLAGGIAGPMSFVHDPSSFALGANADEVPAGLAWGLQMRSPSGRLTTYVHELDVREEFHRQGVGTMLIKEAMTIARSCGSTRFWLSTGGHNEVAQALYKSLGGDRKPLGDVNYWWQLNDPVSPE